MHFSDPNRPDSLLYLYTTVTLEISVVCSEGMIWYHMVCHFLFPFGWHLHQNFGGGCSKLSQAYHWSITQLTPASCEIYPSSARERIFNIAVILFGSLEVQSSMGRMVWVLTDARRHRASTVSTRHLRLWNCEIETQAPGQIENAEAEKSKEVSLTWSSTIVWEVHEFAVLEKHLKYSQPRLCVFSSFISSMAQQLHALGQLNRADRR